jgi:hypothetical protein
MKEYNVGDIIRVSRFIGFISFCEIIDTNLVWDTYYTVVMFSKPYENQKFMFSFNQLQRYGAEILS